MRHCQRRLPPFFSCSLLLTVTALAAAAPAPSQPSRQTVARPPAGTGAGPAERQGKIPAARQLQEEDTGLPATAERTVQDGTGTVAKVANQEPTSAGSLTDTPPAKQVEAGTGDEGHPVAENSELDSWRERWSSIWLSITDYWNRVLFMIDDRPLRLGALVRSAIVFLVLLLFARAARSTVRRTLLKRLGQRADASTALVADVTLAVARQTKRTFVILLALYLALITLPLPPALRSLFHSVAIIGVTIQVAVWVIAVVGRVIEKTKERRVAEDPSAASAFGLMGFFARVAVWSAALLLVLTNLGYEIGPLLAGLGVGGVAVAFALQHILGDIFCSIAIVLDKPFVVGDFIVVGDLLGSVESIGIKTTRIRSLSGEQIVFSNADLIASRVRNYKRMFQRRVVFGFGVVYETPLEKLKQIPTMVRGLIEGLEQTRFDRAHFKDYGDSSLNFEVVYYVLTPDYNAYMDIQQAINLGLFQAFQEEGIAFAYPTREIILRPGGSAHLSLQPPGEPARDADNQGG